LTVKLGGEPVLLDDPGVALRDGSAPRISGGACRSDTTSSTGAFSLSHRTTAGRYYARASSQVMGNVAQCGGARSRSVVVR
jgi:hypothetical protein